jgi:hypothetical protein
LRRHKRAIVDLGEDRPEGSRGKEEASMAAGRTLVYTMGHPFGKSPHLGSRQLPDDRTIAMRYPTRA